MGLEQLNQGPWCMACGYCLHGLAETTQACPECGGSLDAISISVPRPVLDRRLMLARMAALIPGAVIALEAFLFIAPFSQNSGAYRYAGDWRKPDSTAIHFAIVSIHSRQIVLGYALAWPVHERSGSIGVGTRSLSTQGIDPSGDYALEIEPGSLDCQLVDAMNGNLVRRMGRFNLGVAHELVSLNVDRSASPEWAEPVADAVQSIASGVPLRTNPSARTNDGSPEANWASWAVTAGFGVVGWWAMAKIVTRRVIKGVRS